MEWLVSLPERLDSFLAADGRMRSRAHAQKMIEAGQVLVNDAIVTKSAQRLQEGDKVSLDDSRQITDDSSAKNIQPVDLHLDILYEDDRCLVTNKPSGIAVHPGAGMESDENTILNGIAFLLKERGLPFSASAVLVHRLDRETTGCLLIAKDSEAHIQMQEQFQSRTIEKIYLALVAGVPSPLQAMIDAPVGRSTSNRTKMAILGASTMREAQTTYTTLAAKKNLALLSCTLHTGRTHQIRVHLSSLGHPVLGDPTYSSELSERIRDEYDIRNLCLHAWKLAFVSPADGKKKEVVAPLPRALNEVLTRVGILFIPA